jgi:tetratricopeptide (TPR) repeat protein
MKFSIGLLSGVIGLALLATPAKADTVITECDRLAAHPEDPQKVTPGINQKDIDYPKAIAACEQALVVNPNDPRARYQLARVLFYTNQNERAVAEMKRAADAGPSTFSPPSSRVSDRLRRRTFVWLSSIGAKRRQRVGKRRGCNTCASRCSSVSQVVPASPPTPSCAVSSMASPKIPRVFTKICSSKISTRA